MFLNNMFRIQCCRAGLLNDSSVKPINLRYANIDFVAHPEMSYQSQSSHTPSVGLLVIVKSARSNVEKRRVVRQTWAESSLLKENALSARLPTKVFFICGVNFSEDDAGVNNELKLEERFKDIIIANFNDSYANNTYKSMLAFKWALTEFKGNFKYLALFDDDIYVDMVNVGAYLRELPYKRVVKEASKYSEFPVLRLTSRRDSETTAIPELGHGLYIGKVYAAATPERHSCKL
jgi:hypothetical protein